MTDGKTTVTHQVVCRLRPAVQLAEEVGPLLGAGQVLL